MNINYEKNQIVVYGKAVKYDAFIKKLADLSGEQIYGFFSNRGIMMPRMMNCMALTSVLNGKIKFLTSNSLTKDYFTRLQHFEDFTETQLENLFIAVNGTAEDFAQYRYNLMKLIMDNYQALDINDGEITYLKNLKKSKRQSFEDYVGYISAACLEQEGTFDGALIENLKKDLMFTATNQEIILIGEKYGITVPERLQKEEYVGFIKYYLNKTGKMTDEANEVLDGMSLNALSIYAKREGIPMQPSMSKDDLVTYLFYYLEQCDIPHSSVTTIAIDPMYSPLKFTVDLSVISVFGNGDAKKIIHYEGEEADQEAYDAMLDEINNPVEPAAPVIEEVQEPLPEVDIERPLRPGETKEQFEEEKKANAPKEELKPEEEKKEEAKPEITMETKPAKVIPLAEKLGVDVDRTVRNESYASKKLMKKSSGRGLKIAFWITAGVIFALFAFLIVAMFM